MDKQHVQQVINDSNSFSEAARMLKVPKYALWKFANEHSLILKKNQSGTNISKKRKDGLGKIPLSEIFEGLHQQYQTKNLKRRLIEEDLKEDKCEICGITEWQNRPINLQLHHINGKGEDHRFENLQILCPNCHSLTSNFCGKNVKR